MAYRACRHRHCFNRLYRLSKLFRPDERENQLCCQRQTVFRLVGTRKHARFFARLETNRFFVERRRARKSRYLRADYRRGRTDSFDRYGSFRTIPVFSPDGTHIAFVRDFKTYGEIILIPALGGAERRVARVFSGNYSISFAPDGKSIAVVDATEDGGKQYAIYTIDIKTGDRRRVTKGGELAGETTPRFSPDGKSLAFVGVFPDYAQDLYVVSTEGENSEPLRLTSDLKTIHSLAWSADGSEIFFVSTRESNTSNIWRIGAAGGSPEFLSINGKGMSNLAAAPDGKMLAFVENTKHSDIYRLTVGETATKPLIATSFTEDVPNFSPDGRHIVFHSNRSGNTEAWIADADGKNLRQITDSTRQVGVVRFSPDGTLIAFHARDGENKDIYVASVEGGEPRRLTTDAASDVFPSWSADGKYIYFASDRTGENQLWRVPSNGGDAVQITRGGGFESSASADGKWIYYTKIRRMSACGAYRQTRPPKTPTKRKFPGSTTKAFKTSGR